jgi:hypothetical protein
MSRGQKAATLPKKAAMLPKNGAGQAWAGMGGQGMGMGWAWNGIGTELGRSRAGRSAGMLSLGEQEPCARYATTCHNGYNATTVATSDASSTHKLTSDRPRLEGIVPEGFNLLCQFPLAPARRRTPRAENDS